jgi:hypothetical protein
LKRLAEAHPDWVLGYEDETWWSRLAVPATHAWTGDGCLRLKQKTVPKDDPDPKALACFGTLMYLHQADGSLREEIWLRFAAGQPESELTIGFLQWCCAKLAAAGKKAWLLVWDQASWHISKRVRNWIREHNRRVKATGQGVRILACVLPIKSPWLNPLEPHWRHGKRQVVEPERLLPARELEDRVYAYFGCTPEEHLVIPKNVS